MWIHDIGIPKQKGRLITFGQSETSKQKYIQGVLKNEFFRKTIFQQCVSHSSPEKNWLVIISRWLGLEVIIFLSVLFFGSCVNYVLYLSSESDVILILQNELCVVYGTGS